MPWTLKHSETPLDEIGPLMEAEVKNVLPGMLDEYPGYVVTPHFWRYSQAYKGVPGDPGFLELQEKILITGDAFSGSFDGVDSCVRSALKSAEFIKKRLNLAGYPECAI